MYLRGDIFAELESELSLISIRNGMVFSLVIQAFVIGLYNHNLLGFGCIDLPRK